MKPLDSYLQTVRFWLPKGQRDDIIAELSEDIRSQMDEREAELGRPLTDPDVQAILERWGHPLRVAERYLPNTYLIGPVLFPLYRLALTIVSILYLGPWLLVWLGLAFFSPSYRDAHPGLSPLVSWWLLGLHLFTAITVAFAFVERFRPAWIERWPPRTPPPPDPNYIQRSHTIGELVSSVVFMLWWIGVLQFPDMPDVEFTRAPILGTLFWPVLIFYAALSSLDAVNLVRPWWTERRAAVRLAIDLTGLALISVLLAAGRWIILHVPDAPPEKLDMLAKVEQWANLPVLVTLGFIGLACLLKAVQNVRRLRHQKPIRHWAMNMLSGE